MIAQTDEPRDAEYEERGRKSLYDMVLGEGVKNLRRTPSGDYVALSGDANLEMMIAGPMAIDYRLVLRTDGTWSCYIQFSE